MMNGGRALLVLCTVALFLSGCAAARQRPLLYPNARLSEVGPDSAERDVDECLRLADAYVASGGRGGTVARDTAIGGGTGAAIGAVGGAIYGNAGRGAAAGAATGATAGLLHALFRETQPSPIYKSYVGTCLSERGYQVLGWN